jgi:hypothetical protein
MDSDGIQILVESAFVSLVMLTLAVLMILKARDAIAPAHRIGSYDWGKYQYPDREQLQVQGDSSAPKHA